MDDMDDIPDLDDMSDMVNSIKLSQQGKLIQTQQTSLTQNSTPDSDKHEGDETDNVNRKSAQIKPDTAISVHPKKQFAGMKKGFLFGTPKDSPIPRPVKGQKKFDDIIAPKKNAQQNNPLVLDEVQEAMKGDFSSDKSWMTEDLLKQVDSNEKLSKQLMDPRISKAVTWMQRDPKGAMEYYKDDVEIQNFFKEFYGLLGSHFSNLGDKQPQSTSSSTASNKIESEDDKAMREILSNQEIRDILSKPEMQSLLQQLRSNPDVAQRTLNSGSRTFRDDVNKLVSAGVLAFEPH